jgi:hypothetical protein
MSQTHGKSAMGFATTFFEKFVSWIKPEKQCNYTGPYMLKKTFLFRVFINDSERLDGEIHRPATQ